MPLQSRPIVVPNPDPSLNWTITYKQALALQIVLARTKDLLVNVHFTPFGYEGLFKIRWPLDKTGNKVPPERVYRYLKARYVTWKCFCVVDQFGDTRRVRFTTKPDGSVMVYCGFISSRCPYKLNLSKIFHRIEITPSKYENYPTSFDRMAYRAAIHHLVKIEDGNSGHHHHGINEGGEVSAGGNTQGNEGQGEAILMHNNNAGGEASAGGEGGEGGGGGNGNEDDTDDDDNGNGDYDWGVHECCGEPVEDPKEFVVPIMDGWLGFGAGNPSDYSSMLEWAPGKFGWPVREDS